MRLKNDLFRVIFRDVEFMKALDKSIKGKDTYEEQRLRFVPETVQVSG
jgi:hypothetical protein